MLLVSPVVLQCEVAIQADGIKRTLYASESKTRAEPRFWWVRAWERYNGPEVRVDPDLHNGQGSVNLPSCLDLCRKSPLYWCTIPWWTVTSSLPGCATDVLMSKHPV